MKQKLLLLLLVAFCCPVMRAETIYSVQQDCDKKGNFSFVMNPNCVYYGGVLASAFDKATTIEEKARLTEGYKDFTHVSSDGAYFHVYLNDLDRTMLKFGIKDDADYNAYRQHYLVCIAKFRLSIFESGVLMETKEEKIGDYYIYKIANPQKTGDDHYYFNFTGAKTINDTEITWQFTFSK